VPRPHVLEVRASRPPTVPPFAEVASMPKIDGAPTFTQHIDLRFALGGIPFSGAVQPEVGGWCRLRHTGVPDLETICVLLDAWPLPALSMLTRPTPGATIDSTYHFPSALPPRPSGEDEPPYLFHCVSPTVEDGYAEHMGQLWTAEGLLVGRVRQMAAIF
jgi:hypothetical protein